MLSLAGDALNVGDYICLYSVETEGYVYSQESSSARNSLFVYQNQSRDKPLGIPNPQAVVFQVCIQNRYKLNKKYRKMLEQLSSSGENVDKKGLLAQTGLAARAENADNAAEQKRQQGKRVRYGELVQLRHIFTGKYIHMCTSQTSQVDKNNMMVMLNEYNAKNAQFRILPQYKVKSEGEVVQILDQIVFESIKSPGHFLHASHAYHIRRGTVGCEINLGVDRSGFSLVRFSKDNPELEHFVKGGSVIRLFHKELEAYLVAEGLFDDSITEDVHYRVRVMDQHKPRTLSPPTSGNTYWQIEAESSILNGEVLRWEQQVRLRHLPTRKYLAIEANKDILLVDSNNDPRTVMRLYSVISEHDEIRFESYARIEHVLTGFWLHALKDEDYVRKQFRDGSDEQSLKNLAWDNAPVRQVAASGECAYDDAFTIQWVDPVYCHNFNFVAGMVPFFKNLIDDRHQNQVLNMKRTQFALTAMTELKNFMLVNNLPNKPRQKLMRNLKVIDLLVRLLQCPLDGVSDELNLIQVFKEAYEILYTYMRGRSRKNALYFAKYIEFFQTQFTQKGGIGINVAQMIVELIRDKRKIVDRITHDQINQFVSLLRENQNYRFLDLLQVLCVCDEIAIPNNQTYIVRQWLQGQHKGVFLTARGQDINRQPNIIYITTDGGYTWTALHSFVEPDGAEYNQDKYDFLLHQLDLYKALCHGRNDYAINAITKELRYLTWEETFLCLRSDILPDSIRAKYCDLTTSLFVDVGNNYSVLAHPNICFIYDYVGSKDEEKSQSDYVVKELVAIFPVLRDWIADFLQNNKSMIASLIGLNMLIEQVLRLLYCLVQFGYYMDLDDVQQLLPLLLHLLDAKHDYPFPKDKEKGYSKEAQKKVTVYQASERYEVSPETEAIINAKYQALEVIDLLLTYQRNMRLQGFVAKFKSAELTATRSRGHNQSGLVPLLYTKFDSQDSSKKGKRIQKQANKDLKDMFHHTAIFDEAQITRILQDLSNYKYDKILTKSMDILNKVYSAKTNMFVLSKKVLMLLTQDSGRVHREVLKHTPIMRRLARAKLDHNQMVLFSSILDDLSEFCHLPMTPGEPHPINQNILISNGILNILFDVLVQDVDSKLQTEYSSGMKAIFRKTLQLLRLLAKENEAMQNHIFERLDLLLDVELVESDLALALKEVFYGNANTCLKIHQRQIQKIVNRVADLQEDAPEFLDLLSIVVKVAGSGLIVKRNQAFVMKYIMQNYKKVAYVLDLGREEREAILTDPNRYKTQRYYISLLDLLATCAEGENMFIESLCQTILPLEELLWVLNNSAVDNVLKKPFVSCVHNVYMRFTGSVVETASGELPHHDGVWDYMSGLYQSMNKLTDSVIENPEKLAVYFKTAPEKTGIANAPDFEASSYGSCLYFLESVLPFLTSFFNYFYFPDATTSVVNTDEVEETDHIAKALVLFTEVVSPLLYKPQHMKNLVNALNAIVPVSNLPDSNLDTVLDKYSKGIVAEDTTNLVRKGNIEYYSEEVELNAKLSVFAKNAHLVYGGHNTVMAQLKIKSAREYTDIGSDEQLPLGEEFQCHVKCFVNTHEKKAEKRYLACGRLIQQLHISCASSRMWESQRQELIDLNIKCLQLLRAVVHNVEKAMPEDWETRTSEPKIMKQLKVLTDVQNYFNTHKVLYKTLPHLASRCDDMVKEVFAFVAAMLYNANKSVQQSMYDYFMSTREEVFFMAVRDRMQLSSNSIKERRSLEAQERAKGSEDAQNICGTSAIIINTALKHIAQYERVLYLQRLAGWTKRGVNIESSMNKKKSVKKKKKDDKDVKSLVTKNGKSPKKNVKFGNYMDTSAGYDLDSVSVEEPDGTEILSEDDKQGGAYRDDGFIVLVLKVMARMCDGQNWLLQDYLREQPDNIKSFNIIAEVTRFVNVVYSNINSKSVDLVIQLFDTMNEFTAGNQENRCVIYENKIVDFINFILRAVDFEDCPQLKILELRQSIANLIMSLIEENGPAPSLIAWEVKDTLDKKAVYQLMEDFYLAHQPIRNKADALELPKAVSPEPGDVLDVIPAQSTNKFQDLFRKKKLRENADVFMDVGFSFFLILCRLYDIDPKMGMRRNTYWSSMSIFACPLAVVVTPSQQVSYDFYKKNCMSIEVVKDDHLQKINFRVKSKRVLREEVKETLKWTVDRSSPSNKIRDLMMWTQDIMKDIAYQKRILSNPIAVVITKGWLLWNHLVTLISLAINVLMLLTWRAKLSLPKDRAIVYKNASSLPPNLYNPIPVISVISQKNYQIAIYILGGIHNFFCLMVLISYFVCNHPRMPYFSKIFANVKRYFHKKEDTDPNVAKKKKHVSKLDAKFFSFNTFFYFLFLGLSICGTFFHGYFFAFHLLNIVNNNQLLGGVIKAVTQNGRSLVWVAILGLIVFYLYGIVGFALMRSMFNPNDNLYCNSLWQCTITVIRYGLIGDLFEVMKAHPAEATFSKFGFVVLYHVSFFIFITTIGLNIIFGIIVDTFSELRDLKWKAESDMRDTCFICSRNSYDFEHHGKGFDHHVRNEHNMWAYIYFLIHLNGTKVNDYTALEMFIYKLLVAENNDFFPLDRALSLASMGKDSTDTKLDSLINQVLTIVDRQRTEEIEKKRREDKMRQKLWEQKHRLGSFRRKAKLPGPKEVDPISLGPAGLDALSSFMGRRVSIPPSTPLPETTKKWGDASLGTAKDVGGMLTVPSKDRGLSPRPGTPAARALTPISVDVRTGVRERLGSVTPTMMARRSSRDFSLMHPDSDAVFLGTISPVRFDESRRQSVAMTRHDSEVDLLAVRAASHHLSPAPSDIVAHTRGRSPGWRYDQRPVSSMSPGRDQRDLDRPEIIISDQGVDWIDEGSWRGMDRDRPVSRAFMSRQRDSRTDRATSRGDFSQQSSMSGFQESMDVPLPELSRESSLASGDRDTPLPTAGVAPDRYTPLVTDSEYAVPPSQAVSYLLRDHDDTLSEEDFPDPPP